MQVKRIAVISYHTCPLSDEKNADFGGMNTYVLELSKALSKKGLVTDIFTRCTDKASPKMVEVGPNLRIFHIKAGIPKDIPKKELLKYTSEFSNNSSDLLKKEKIPYDLISAHYYLSGLIGLKLKEKIKVPLFVTFHTLALMKNLVSKNENKKEDLQRIQQELQLTKKSDKIIATSKIDQEYIHTLYDCPLEKISLLSPGVNLKLFKPIDKSKAKRFIKANLNHKIILFAGRIDPLKGIDVLLYAIKILKRKNLSFCLWIVGGNNKKGQSKELKYLQEIKRTLGISSNVKFVGQKTQEELPYYYNAAEIVLMPSQYESFGITALEAMACAVPVIITDVSGISGLLDIKHSPLLASSGNPIGLAGKIKDLLTNEEKHRKMSQEVFKKVQNLSWDERALEFIQILTR